MDAQRTHPRPHTSAALDEAVRILEAGGGDDAVRARLVAALRTSLPVEEVETDDVGRPRSGRLAEVGAYLGATLVIAAGVVFISSLHEQLGRSGVGACVLATGLLLALVSAAAQKGGGHGAEPSGREQARRRLVGIAGYAAALGVGVGVGLVSGLDTAAASLSGALVVAVGTLVRARTAPWESPSAQVWGIGACGVAIAAASALTNDPKGALLAGVGAYALGTGWTLWGLRQTEYELACALGLAVMLIGGEVTVSDQPGLGYLLLAGAAAAGLAIDSRWRCTPALGLAVASTTIVVPQAVTHYTHGSLGAAGALLIGGLALLVASGVGTGLRRYRGHDLPGRL